MTEGSHLRRDSMQRLIKRKERNKNEKTKNTTQNRHDPDSRDHKTEVFLVHTQYQGLDFLRCLLKHPHVGNTESSF